MQLPDFLYTDSDGEVRFRGHRLRLIDVAARFEEGCLPETIAFDLYPTLDLALVYKAIGFYLEHQAEVGKMIDASEKEIARQALQPGTGPTLAELRRRLEAKRRAEAS